LPTPSSTKRVLYDDFVFVVDENVYEPAEDSFLFAANLAVKEGDAVLDMGTGCGLLGILAARKALWVLAVDVNPYALRCAKENASLNGTQDRMAFVQGDLFAPVSDLAKFNVVLFNAPYLPSPKGEPPSWVERAWVGGESGRLFVDRFINHARDHLQKTGRVMLMQSTYAGVDETMRLFGQLGMNAKIMAELALPFFERLFLIEATNG